MYKNTSSTYGIVSKSLHWLVAAVILGMFAVGIWMVELTYYDQWYKDAPYYHKSVGIILAFIMIFRIFWRYLSPPPEGLKSHKPIEQKLAKATHLLIYILIFTIIISGYLISTADERGISVFGLFELPSIGTLLENQEDIAGLFHQWLAYILIGLVVLHAAAALKHHFVDKDNTLKRMIN
ncbi:cytochrome b [Aliikangiella sp. IMCC44359]|uniref:cytochrome b n=1 Tax=Aliikangiella sp. IMCC44359 TaxID=3459125 RepID=UPI00403B375A